MAAFGDAAIKDLLPLLKSDKLDHRWWALRALAEFDHPSAREALCHVLADGEHPALRHCAAMGLREKPTPKALPALISALYEKDRLLSRLAADALAALGPSAIPELQEAIQSIDPSVRIEAVRALAKMHDPQTIGALFSVLEDPSSLVMFWAEKGLDDLGVGMVFFEP